MLFRMINRFINIGEYIKFFYFILFAAYSKHGPDYRRFLIFSIKNLGGFIFIKPIYLILFCFQVIFYIISIMIKAHNIVMRALIKYLFNFFIFNWECYNYEHRYLAIEIAVMFPEAFLYKFKYHWLIIFYDYLTYLKVKLVDRVPLQFKRSKLLVKDKELEIIYVELKDYEQYRDENTEQVPAPDLKVYYPMRYALSSIMIRLTGLILAVSLLFILIFEYTNLFALVHNNFGELRRSVSYKYIEFIIHYESYYYKYFPRETKIYARGLTYYNENYENTPVYTNSTLFSSLKCFLGIFGVIFRNLYYYFVVDMYQRFDLLTFEANKTFYLNYFYNFLKYIFIYVLPIHIYYVIFHSFSYLSPREIIHAWANAYKRIRPKIVKYMKISFFKSLIAYNFVFKTPEPRIYYNEDNFLNNWIKKKLKQYNDYVEVQNKLFQEKKEQELKKKI